MKTCPKCGEQNSDANRYCSVCSTSLSSVTASSSSPKPIPAAQVPTPISATTAHNVCPNCGEQCSSSNRFCNVCGASLPVTPKPSFTPPVSNPSYSTKFESNTPPKKPVSPYGPVINNDYGEHRTSFLFGVAKAICIVLCVFTVIFGIVIMSAGAWWGILVMLGGIAVSVFSYFILSAFVYIYSNIARTAKHTDAQLYHTLAQTEALNILTASQNEIISNLNKLSESINDLHSDHESNMKVIKAHSEIVSNIERTQVQLVSLQNETLSQLQQFSASATESLKLNSKTESDFKDKLLNVLSKCTDSLESIPNRIRAMFSNESLNSNEDAPDTLKSKR